MNDYLTVNKLIVSAIEFLCDQNDVEKGNNYCSSLLIFIVAYDVEKQLLYENIGFSAGLQFYNLYKHVYEISRKNFKSLSSFK